MYNTLIHAQFYMYEYPLKIIHTRIIFQRILVFTRVLV